MTIEACMKCSDMTVAFPFYTEVLDFTVQVAPDPDKEAFMSKYALLERNGSLLHLSSHEGDGVFGNLIYIRTLEIDALYQAFISRGINVNEPNSYPAVTIKPIEQTWGMKEFSIRDPDGNKITFGQESSNR